MSHKNDRVIAVMFSGGTDSTYAAWSQITNYDHLRLVTFKRDGLRKPQNVQESMTRLMRAFPDKEITHEFVDFEGVYQKVIPQEEKQDAHRQILAQEIGPLWENPHGMLFGREEYEHTRAILFSANECLQCKVAMHVAAIGFCIQENIFNICDGSNTEQLDDGSQLEDVKEIARDIFGRFGINYFSPVFHVSPEERCEVLYKAGITDHLDHKRLEKRHQIPSRQIQCTVPSSVLWTICVFHWLVYDGSSCNDYVEMCYRYYTETMEKGLKIMGCDLKP